MKVYILYHITQNFDGEFEDRIYKIYDSEPKANAEKARLEAEAQAEYDAMSKWEKKDFEECGGQIDRYYVKPYDVY